MKNLLSILALLILTIAFASCKKDYTCECTTTSSVGNKVENFTITDTKSDAKAECNEKEKSSSFLNTDTKCVLK